MRVIDFRCRPPVRGFGKTIMFQEIQRTARMSADIGLDVGDSFRKQSGDLLIQEMDRAGIEKAVMPGRVNSVIGTVPNDDLETIANEYNGRFVPLVAIDPRDRKAAVAEVQRCMKKAVFKGAVVEPGLMPSPWYLDDARLYPIYAYLEDNRIPLLFMAGGNAGPDVTYSSPEHIDRVARDFPTLKIISGHGNWPWASQIIHVCYRRPNIYLSPDMYMHGNFPGAQEYLNALNGFLADRFLYASAYPFLSVEKSLDSFLRMPIKDEVKERALYKNAATLLGI
jgi:hypothetical protein